MSDTTSPDISAWSKWITGVSLFSGFGCITVLVAKGVGEKNIINIKLAIVFFLLTVVVAWLIQLAVALKVIGKLLIILIALEIVMFSLSTFYLAKWVWKFPSTSPPPRQAGAGSEKEGTVSHSVCEIVFPESKTTGVVALWSSQRLSLPEGKGA
jgi:hypothetical protein